MVTFLGVPVLRVSFLGMPVLRVSFLGVPFLGVALVGLVAHDELPEAWVPDGRRAMDLLFLRVGISGRRIWNMLPKT
jgi:hypothetical protein